MYLYTPRLPPKAWWFLRSRGLQGYIITKPMNNNNGWIKLHRQLRLNKFYSNPNALAIWIECLLRAQHEKNEFFHGRELIVLDAGQFLFGEEELGALFNVSRQTARYWINLFFLDNMLDIKKTTKGSIGTIKNWNEYQFLDSDLDNKKTTDGQQKDTSNNVNNVKNVDNNTKVLQPAVEFGNSEINEMLNSLKIATGRTDFKEAQQLQRRYALHFVNLRKKIGVEEFKRRFATIFSDAFKSKNCGSLRYLYGEMKSVQISEGLKTTQGVYNFNSQNE